MNVYDFDNTIYRGESSIHLLLFYIKKHPSLIKYLPKTVWGVLKYKMRLVTINDLISVYSSYAEPFFSNFEVGAFEKDMVEFWDHHIQKIKPFYFAQKSGDDLIVTASAEIMLKELFNRLEIKNYIGSIIDNDSGKILFVCFRENKITAFKKRYPGVVIENFYTDSMNDLPLMELSKNVFLVKGNRIKQIKP